jgi:FAD/FMN-containing dehydrogenase
VSATSGKLPGAAADGLVERLAALLGPERVITDPEELRYYSADAYAAGVTAALALRPADRDAVAPAVRLVTAAGHPVTVRGGGMSYTGGYTPAREGTVVFDLRGLDRIVEIGEDDMVITVEAGVTWRQIHEALTPLGLRLPFFGTFSGARATVGGGLSNGALFMATARHGTAADIVLGLEAVAADGSLVRTGLEGFRNGRACYRNYGPDLTGLFLHDAGALGIKTLASLRLIEAPQHLAYASLAFPTQETAVAALSDIARGGVAEELYIFDPVTTARSLDPAGLKEDLQRLGAVIRGQGSLWRGLAEGLKVVGAGRDFVEAGLYTLHAVCAGRSRAAVQADRDELLARASRHGGLEIADTIPKAARAEPFAPLNGILGADGERWAALNAKIAHSDAPRLIDATDALTDGYRARMEACGVTMSFLYIAISNHVFSYEPVFRWHDAWLPVHRRTPEPEYLAKLEEPPANQGARELVAEMRAAIVALFADFGAASNQIGKTYPLLANMNPAARDLLRSLKRELDPAGLMNPGALGDFGTGAGADD